MAISLGIIDAKRVWKSSFAAGAVNVNGATVESLLVANGAPTNRAIELEVPEGTTLYNSTAPLVLSAGDLSAWPRVKLSVRGSVLGSGGFPAYIYGGHALDASNQANYTITLFPTGQIRGGGGAGGYGGKGGNGGLGGAGNDITSTWSAYYYASSGTKYMWSNANYSTAYPHWWAGTAFTSGATGTAYFFRSGYIYQKGPNVQTAFYQIRRATYAAGTPGAGGVGGGGGAGGYGRGYGQNITVGSAGSSAGSPGTGTRRAGAGGSGRKGATGGTGGDWGAQGGTGSQGGAGYTGAAGLSYTTTSSSKSTSGGAGTSGAIGLPGGTGGNAVKGLFGGAVFDNKGGIISGDIVQ